MEKGQEPGATIVAFGSCFCLHKISKIDNDLKKIKEEIKDCEIYN